jgi:transposase
MIVSQNGGIPLACKNWDGNSADTKVFKERQGTSQDG